MLMMMCSMSSHHFQLTACVSTALTLFSSSSSRFSHVSSWFWSNRCEKEREKRDSVFGKHWKEARERKLLVTTSGLFYLHHCSLFSLFLIRFCLVWSHFDGPRISFFIRFLEIHETIRIRTRSEVLETSFQSEMHSVLFRFKPISGVYSKGFHFKNLP